MIRQTSSLHFMAMACLNSKILIGHKQLFVRKHVDKTSSWASCIVHTAVYSRPQSHSAYEAVCTVVDCSQSFRKIVERYVLRAAARAPGSTEPPCYAGYRRCSLVFEQNLQF